jgi:hypothetical protein
MGLAARRPPSTPPTWSRRDGVVADLGDRRAGRSRPMQGARTTRTPRRRLALPASSSSVSAPGHGAGQAVAAPDGDRRRCRLAVLHHVEMGVEGRDLEHVGQRQPHRSASAARWRPGSGRWRSWMRCRCSISRSAAAGPPSSADAVERGRVDLAALGFNRPRLGGSRRAGVWSVGLFIEAFPGRLVRPGWRLARGRGHRR